MELVNSRFDPTQNSGADRCLKTWPEVLNGT